MSQSLVKNLVHFVYSTKHRQSWIPAETRDGLYAYQAGILEQWNSPALVIGGVADHVHALITLSKNHALMKIVEEVKKGSSKWMKVNGPKNKDFHWQSGYAAFAVSPSNVVEVQHRSLELLTRSAVPQAHPALLTGAGRPTPVRAQGHALHVCPSLLRVHVLAQQQP